MRGYLKSLGPPFTVSIRTFHCRNSSVFDYGGPPQTSLGVLYKHYRGSTTVLKPEKFWNPTHIKPWLFQVKVYSRPVWLCCGPREPNKDMSKPGSLEQGRGLSVWLELCVARSRGSVNGWNKCCPEKPAAKSPIKFHALPARLRNRKVKEDARYTRSLNSLCLRLQT